MRLAHRSLGATLVLTAALSCAAGEGARATQILSFGQTTSADLIDATNPTPTTTLIAGSSIPILISNFIGAATPFAAYLSMDLSSSGAAVITLGQVLEPFSGTVSFTSGAGDTGTNYLSATFTDFVFGAVGGSSLALSASEPPGSVSFTSSVLSQTILQDPKALAFAFADVTGPATVTNGTLEGFTSTVTGTISASPAVVPVPEPATLTLLAAGLVVTGAVFARRRPGA